jgi:hypothetical protein
MPQVLKSLIVVAFFATFVFVVARTSVSPTSVSASDFARRRNVWFALTLSAYLAHNFWLFLACAAVLLWLSSDKDQNPLALFCLAIFALPPFQVTMSLPGGANLLDVTPSRLFSICVLLPYSISLWRRGTRQASALHFSSWAVALLLVFMWVAVVPHLDSITSMVRHGMNLVLDYWLPFYAASRGLSSIRQYREVAVSLVLALCIVGILATFETARRWNVYDILSETLGFPGTGVYLTRVEGGPLRARLMTGWPIVLGYLMIIGLGMLLYLSKSVKRKLIVLLAFSAIMLGLISSFSRGPWVGAAVTLLVFFLAGPGVSRRLLKAFVLLLPVCVGILLSPLGGKIIDYLPFVGSVDTGSVTYRTRLFDVSLEVFFKNPWFGDVMFMQDPILEQMRQGQGIIDVTNTYLLYALPYGVVGLCLFVAPFVRELLAVWRNRYIKGEDAAEHELLGRALVACLLGLLVTLGTASTIFLIPTTLYFLLGAASAYVAMAAAQSGEEARQLSQRAVPKRPSLSDRRRA